MRPLETSLFRIYPFRILGWWRGKRWVPSDWRPLETLFSRHHQRLVKRQKMTFKCHLPLESSLYQLEKSRIFCWSRSKKWLESYIWQLESSLLRLYQIAFSASPEAENKWRMPYETLQHRFFELTQVAFWDGQETEYEFKVKCDPLNHRFLDFTQVAFWAG